MTPPDPHADLPAITPSLVQDLRDSIQWRVSNGQTPLQPHIIYMAAESRFLCLTSGRPQCAHADPRVLARLLICERAEPGFVARIMDPTTDCRTASLAPDAAAHERRRLDGLRAEARQRDTADAERKRQRTIVARTDVGKLTLDDLL